MKNIKVIIAGILFAMCLLFTTQTEVIADELTGKSAMEITELMGIGWNLGNTLDANGTSYTGNVYSHETYWGNPQVTETLIKGVKAAGFNTIRIPVTWYTELDSNYQIKAEFLNRVQQIVDMAIDQGMFVILNVHHEAWINNSSLADNAVKIGEELSAVWAQLAKRFASYDQHLIFEGMNEPRYEGASNEWSGDEAGYQAVNYLNHIFVTTVRENNTGYNSERCLMCPQYAASNSGSIMGYWTYPTAGGKDPGNIIVSVHGYAPYSFCLSDDQSTWSASVNEDTAAINTMFENIDKFFLSQGIAVVIGETSATNTNNNSSARANWSKYMGEMSKAYGVPIVIWDNGVYLTTGGECHGWIDRNTGKVTDTYADSVSNLVLGYKSGSWGSSRKGSSQSQSSLINGSVIWQNKSGLALSGWDSKSLVMASSASYFVAGSDIAIVYKGSDGIGIVFDSEALQKWWIWVNPYKTESVNGYNVAYFNKSGFDSVFEAQGVSDYSQLRNLSIVTKGNETVYELAQCGAKTITCIANGKVYHTGTSLPATDPSYKNMTFLGWYTTKKYQSKYEGGALTESMTLYAKFATPSKATEGPEIDAQPTDYSVYEGKVAKFTVTATGTELTYQWQTSTDGNTWRNSGYVSAVKPAITFTSKSSQNNSYYRCVIRDSLGNEVITRSVKLTVISKPKISSQPKDCLVTVGKIAKFTVSATGENLTYQWQTSTNGTTWRNSGYASAVKPAIVFTSKLTQNGSYYRCRITDAYGNTVISNVVKLTVRSKTTITKQPVNCTVKAGNIARFTVAAEGEGLSYQWQTSTDGTKWRNSGYTSAVKATISFTSKSTQNRTYYRCVITDAEGNEIVSDAVMLLVQ